MEPRVVSNFDELKELVGHEIGVSDWHEVPQSQIDAFANLTDDRQWIHTDPQRASRESPYSTTIAHGFLTVALLSGLQREVVQIRAGFSRAINYGMNRLRFPAAVPSGSRIRLRSKLAALKEIDHGIECTWEVSVEIEGQSKPALVAEWLSRLYR